MKIKKNNENNILLSIVIITMNRASQLVEAINSCLKCNFIGNTEIIIIDNGSTDNTEIEVKKISENSKISVKYFRMNENLGIAEGRNEGYRKSKGKYVYNLDDDSVINSKYYATFFIETINYLQRNPNVATLTTPVYDLTLGRWRESKKAKNYNDKYPLIFAFHGNTYFIRKNIEGLEFPTKLKYGYEDVYASIKALDKGFINGIYSGVSTIHKPKFNKWIKDTSEYIDVIVKGVAGMMTVKYLLYPKIYKPFLFLGFFMRWYKHSRKYPGTLIKSYKLFRLQTENITVDKIKHKTIFKIFKEFGLKYVL